MVQGVRAFGESLGFLPGSETRARGHSGGHAPRSRCVCALSGVQLWDPVEYSPPGSSVHGVSQARVLEWVAISSSRGPSRPRDGTGVSSTRCTGRRAPHLSHVGRQESAGR